MWAPALWTDRCDRQRMVCGHLLCGQTGVMGRDGGRGRVESELMASRQVRKAGRHLWTKFSTVQQPGP